MRENGTKSILCRSIGSYADDRSRGVIRLAAGCYKYVIRLAAGCYKYVIRLAAGCYEYVIRLAAGCYKYVASVATPMKRPGSSVVFGRAAVIRMADIDELSRVAGCYESGVIRLTEGCYKRVFE